MLRREFLCTSAAAVSRALGQSVMTPTERVDKALKGADLDRPPFTLWHHFGLKTPETHAERTLAFHRAYKTDIVKVMSDFPYPKPSGKWYELKPLANPFPEQVRALELIRDGLRGRAYFVETLFNPWNVAQKLSSKEDVLRLKDENPQVLMKALDVITESEINHAKKALKAGAAGIFLSVANANAKELSPADYARFSRQFDKRIVDAVAGAKLNVLHLHAEAPYLEHFRDFRVPVINYSLHVSGIPIADLRRQYDGVIAGGIDETRYRMLSAEELKAQWKAAAAAAGPRFILTPGCSVPDDSKPEELSRIPTLVGA